jgi:hypothetical protein
LRCSRRAAVAVVCLLTLAGCGSTATPDLPTPSASTLPSGIVVAAGHGWTSARLDGSIPAPGACRLGTGRDGEPLPDPHCTPGAVDAAVTDANRRSTVCRKGGYTGSVRPPVALTDAAKRRLLAAYGIAANRIGDYELDHLVALNDGGASDVRNLWPEPNTFRQFHETPDIHNDKDAVEDYTYAAICRGTVTVTQVQRVMAADWTTAVAKLGLPPIPADYTGSPG